MALWGGLAQFLAGIFAFLARDTLTLIVCTLWGEQQISHKDRDLQIYWTRVFITRLHRQLLDEPRLPLLARLSWIC